MLKGKRIVVVGAGIGGLAAALRLRADGADVTVLEARARPGGKMRAMDSVAGPVDAGPTVLTMRWVFDDLFAAAGARLEDHVRLHAAPILARHVWPDGARLDLFPDARANARALAGAFGARAASQFRRFDAEARTLFETFRGPMMETAAPSPPRLAAAVIQRPALWPLLLPGASLAGHLSRRFTDPRLRQLFGRYATYVGGAPQASPALLALIWRAEAAGVWAVEGGLHRLAGCLADLAQARGIRTAFGVAARCIETSRGRAVAVQDAAGGRHPCDAVVFNGDPGALGEGRLGHGVADAVRAAGVTPRSLSAHVWAFAARPRGAGLAHHNVFFGADPASEFDPLSQGRPPRDPAIYVCAQDRAVPGRAPGGPERFEIIVNAPPLPHDEPEDTETCHRRTFEMLARRGLTFDPQPGLEAMTTPRDFAAMFPGSAGSLYGRSPHGMLAALARPRARSRVPGLYLAGGGTHPGAGVPMAALSGKHAAEAISADLTSTSRFRRTAMRGGTSTGSATTAPAPSASSPS